MVAAPVRSKPSVSAMKPRSYGIRLKVRPADREDAWELCRVVLHYGGVEVSDCCFAFASEERWLMAMESLRLGFGPEYFESVELATVRKAR